MRKALLAAALLIVSAGSALAQSASALTGVWSGYYGYDGAASPNVQFQMNAEGQGRTFTASTVEPNTFGDRTTWFLTANVAGTLSAGGGVNFVKTYDGTGGQTHSVQYSGTLSGRCITGRWAIGAAGGPFKMCSDAQLVS